MNINQLDEAIRWAEVGPVDILAKAILLNKVTIKDGRIRVEAFKEDEI
jgi:hypothetical protein